MRKRVGGELLSRVAVDPEMPAVCCYVLYLRALHTSMSKKSVKFQLSLSFSTYLHSTEENLMKNSLVLTFKELGRRGRGRVALFHRSAQILAQNYNGARLTCCFIVFRARILPLFGRGQWAVIVCITFSFLPLALPQERKTEQCSTTVTELCAFTTKVTCMQYAHKVQKHVHCVVRAKKYKMFSAYICWWKDNYMVNIITYGQIIDCLIAKIKVLFVENTPI